MCHRPCAVISEERLGQGPAYRGHRPFTQTAHGEAAVLQLWVLSEKLLGHTCLLDPGGL